jgi:hypothetical protein
MELKRSKLSPNRYDYLSEEDSKLYDEVKDSQDPKDKQIKKLLIDKLNACQGAHINSVY